MRIAFPFHRDTIIPIISKGNEGEEYILFPMRREEPDGARLREESMEVAPEPRIERDFVPSRIRRSFRR